MHVPSAELGSLASIQEQTQKWVALCYIVLETPALRSMLTSAVPTVKIIILKNVRPKYSSIYICVIIQSLPHTNALDDEGFSVMHCETLSWKVAQISEWVCVCMR